jgi:hypothetical protein
MPKATTLPGVLVQEIRNLVSVMCRETVMTEKAKGEKQETQWLFHEKSFYGSPGYASCLDNMLSGKGLTASLFNRIPIENNHECIDRLTDSHMLQLQDTFSCDEGKWPLI